eukprot:gene4582-5184_t
MDWLSYSKNNQEMVDKFTRLGIIESSEVEKAFRCVSRAAFVPDDLLDDAFKDTPLRGSCQVHMSAPHMYAAILEELELDSGMSFLNIGSGTGYFSTLVGYILKREGVNHGIELHDELVRFANDKVQNFLQHGPSDVKDICKPIFIAGNCSRLDTEQAKYDRLYCGAACTQANVKFLLELVKVGGFLIAPVGSRLIKLKRVALKEGRQNVINDVSFAPLIAATPDDKKLPKLRFPDQCRKKKKQNAIICNVSFPVCKSPARKLLSQLRAFQDVLDCLENGLPLPMAFCYVPRKEDLDKSPLKQKRFEDMTTSAVDSQIDFFEQSSICQPYDAESKTGGYKNQTAKEQDMMINIDWEHVSTDKTWLKIIEHYYSLLTTTESRRQECFNLKMENISSSACSMKVLTFKKYAKKMGLIPSKSKSASSDSSQDVQKVEEVASDIVNNLLEEVIYQSDENKSAENFIASFTNNEVFKRRSSASKATILDNLPHFRTCSEESNHTLASQQPQSDRGNDLEARLAKLNSCRNELFTMQSTVYQMIQEIDNEMQKGIALDPSHLKGASSSSMTNAGISSEDRSGVLTNDICADMYGKNNHDNHDDNVCENVSDPSNGFLQSLSNCLVVNSSDTTACMNNGKCVGFAANYQSENLAVVSDNCAQSDLEDRFSSFHHTGVTRPAVNEGESLLTSLRAARGDVGDRQIVRTLDNYHQDHHDYDDCPSAVPRDDLDKRSKSIDENETGNDDAMDLCCDLYRCLSSGEFVMDGFTDTIQDGEQMIKKTKEIQDHAEGGDNNEEDSAGEFHQIAPSNESIDTQTESTENRNKVCNPSDTKKRDKSELFHTSHSPSYSPTYSPSFKKKKKKLSNRFTDIRMDIRSSERMRSLPGALWDVKHDKELVLFLSRKERSSGHVAFSPCCASVIKPQDFTNIDLIQYKKICSFPATALAARAIVLKRVAKLLDSVMSSLVGPSLSSEQFHRPRPNEYPLSSFDEYSFEPCGIEMSKFNHSITNELRFNIHNSVKVNGAERGLIESVDKMIQQEIDNVCEQKEVVLAKLTLYDKLNEEYEEQRKLISQQVDLIEEQQQIIQSRLRTIFSIDASCNENVLRMQVLLQERKDQKRQLEIRQEQVETQQISKSNEHRTLLQIHSQLEGLQAKLVKEQKEFLEMGQKYLDKDGGELVNFSKFVAMSNDLVKQLNAISNEDEIDEKSTMNKQSKADDDSVIKNTPKNRYNLQALLPKCRFLFPLTSKRLSIIKELLRTSETFSSHPCYVARVDRRVPLKERHKHSLSNSVFMQLYNSLKNKELNYRDAKRNFEKLWEVKFLGEGIIDQGGGFRDSLAEIADELCPSSADVIPCLPLFIKTPNQLNEVGDHRDAYIPNPSCNEIHLYTWIGKLMGTAFRTDETIPLAFPPFIWKLLVGEHVTWSNDYTSVDETTVRVTDEMELLDAATYTSRHQSEQFFVTHLSDGTEKSLIKDGANILVKVNERKKFAALLRKARMMECVKQVEALRFGLTAVVPKSIISCLTWRELERNICGSPEISINDLKANCRYYELDLSPNDDRVVYLWEAIAGFSSEERSRFIRFVTGRKRLPSPFFLSRSSSDEDNLPTASTCGSNLFLPNYSSASVAAEKIRYAINNCVSIDTDTSPW